MRVERGHQHERILEVLADPLPIGLDPDGAVLVERSATLRQEARRGEHVVEDDRLVDVELEIALRPGEGHRRVATVDLDGDLAERLALGRVDLAGHDRRAGLVLRDAQLADARPRAGGVPAHVVGDLQGGGGQGPE